LLARFDAVAFGEYCDPPTAEGRARTPEKLKTTRAKTEVLYEGEHFGWFAHWVSGVAFPDDDVGICMSKLGSFYWI
jgi:hypothetical protein